MSEPVDRASVVVTFLRMEQAPAEPAAALPPGAVVERLLDCSVAQYRALYDGVGGAYLWWLRRIMPDRQLAVLLQDRRIGVFLLTLDGVAAGFYELDNSRFPQINLAYFGLLPQAVGHRLGYAFLRHAVDGAWAGGARALTVNTCTADHPRALPTYLRAGFRPIREIREEWDIPRRLGMEIPQALRR